MAHPLSRSIRLAMVGAALLLLLAFAAYFSSRGTRTTAYARPLEPVSFCYPWAIAQTTGVAEAMGYFRDEGLAIAFKPYPIGRDALDSMLAGNCDITIAAETPIVFRSFQQQFRILATTHTDDDYNQILVRAGRGISKPSDLENRRIGVLRATSAHFFLYRFLLENGLAIDNVDVIYEPGLEQAQQAFLNGEIDAIALWQPHITRVKAELAGHALVFSAPGLVVTTTNLLASNRLVRNRPQVIPALLRAHLRAIRFARSNREAAIEAFARASKIRRDEARAIWFSNFDLSLSQALLLSLEDEADWVLRNGFLANASQVPNYLRFLYLDGLESVAPQAITVLH